MRVVSAILVFQAGLSPLRADSFYPLRLADPKAVYLTTPDFPAAGDGAADDTGALQKAIDHVQETTGQGIVFIPSGRYRLSQTIHVWAGIRLIGYGPTRPTFILGENTPGYQQGDGKYLVQFTEDRPAAGKPIRDGSPGTFYSAMSNIDIEIRDGNAAAIGVRFHVAQHCYLAHIDFRIGSGRAGIEGVGNETEDCRFFGGDYGILAGKTAPSWPFLLIDSSFQGQRAASIETDEAGLTLVRDAFVGAPHAVEVRQGRAEELWASDCRIENISGPAIVIGEDQNARSQTNLHHVVCQNVPALAIYQDSSRRVSGRPGIYDVRDFCHGLQIPSLQSTPGITTTSDIASLPALPPAVPSDIPALPSGAWTNVADLGAKGDGQTDDTAVLNAAIQKYRTLYFPTGRYRITDTLMLRPDTVLIGLHPSATQILLTDNTAAFGGPGAPKAMIVAPKGGTNIITGLGIDAGINRRAMGVKWMAGAQSMMNDVRFIGGHGTFLANGMRRPVYNNNRTGDADPTRHWDSQPNSLWITDGGGGTFKDIWTPDSYAQSGAYISDTTTSGRIYAMSIEHHVRNEMKIRNVSNWNLFAIQTEEERGESPNAIPLTIENSQNITIANYFIYRVESDIPSRNGIVTAASHDITFRGLHAYSPGKFTFDNTLFDETSGIAIRDREIAFLKVTGTSTKPIEDTRVEKIAGGFNNIDGATADAKGNVYFVDGRWNRIYRWSPQNRTLKIICDTPIDPVALEIDTKGNLLITSHSGTVYALDPDAAEDDLVALEPLPSVSRFDSRPILAQNRWRDVHDILTYAAEHKPWQFVAPDGLTYLPAGEDFVHPAKGQRRALVDLDRAYQLAYAGAGYPFFVADEFGHKTWKFQVSSDGTLFQPTLFAEEGEAGVAVDDDGNVFIAAGQVQVYTSAGKKIGTIEIPERPTSLVFGGADRKTLFVTARTSLYAIHTKPPAAKTAKNHP